MAAGFRVEVEHPAYLRNERRRGLQQGGRQTQMQRVLRERHGYIPAIQAACVRLL